MSKCVFLSGSILISQLNFCLHLHVWCSLEHWRCCYLYLSSSSLSVSHEFISTERMSINKRKKKTRQLLTECRHVKKIVFNLYTEYQITHFNVIGRQSLDVSVINVCSKERMFDSPEIQYIFYTIPSNFFFFAFLSILIF